MTLRHVIQCVDAGGYSLAYGLAVLLTLFIGAGALLLFNLVVVFGDWVRQEPPRAPGEYAACYSVAHRAGAGALFACLANTARAFGTRVKFDARGVTIRDSLFREFRREIRADRSLRRLEEARLRSRAG